MEVVRFDQIAVAPSDLDGFVPVNWTVANDGSLLFLFTEASGSDAVFERYAEGIGIFPVTKMETLKHFRVYRVSDGGTVEKIELPPLDAAFPFVDRFPDGKILIAAARSQWRHRDDYDRNGLVIDPAAGQVSRILLGDGINDLAIDSAGSIWVAYGDEGIFGNFGWGTPKGPDPVGAAGLVCLSQGGEKLWEFTAEPTISDCYALNVSKSDASIYYYTDFPICRIAADRTLRFLRTKLRGCHAFAISETQALFTGQYADSVDVGYRGTLRGNALREVRKVRFVTAGGPIELRDRFVGRGRHLYFSNQSGVYRASLA